MKLQNSKYSSKEENTQKSGFWRDFQEKTAFDASKWV
jgi:hypothetical protein